VLVRVSKGIKISSRETVHFKSEVIRLTEVQAEGEDRTSRLEAFKKALDLENEKLKENMEEKEALLKVSLSTFKCLAHRVLTPPPSTFHQALRKHLEIISTSKKLSSSPLG
jgi:hypothetical protein